MTETIYLTGLGLLVGSFMGLVSLRLPRGEDVVRGRSRCDGCGRTVPPWRMIPVASWLLSRGRCASCGDAIPLRYPLVEAASGAIGLWAALHAPDVTSALITAILGWQLLLVALVDAEHFWLPDRLTAPLFLTGVGAAVLAPPGGERLEALLNSLGGALAGFCGLWLLARLYRGLRGREGLGGGDPFLLGAAGAWVGWAGLPSVLLWASGAGLALVAGLAASGRSVKGSDRLPFGVFLALGAWLTWLYGPLGAGA